MAKRPRRARKTMTMKQRAQKTYNKGFLDKIKDLFKSAGWKVFEF